MLKYETREQCIGVILSTKIGFVCQKLQKQADVSTNDMKIDSCIEFRNFC